MKTIIHVVLLVLTLATYSCSLEKVDRTANLSNTVPDQAVGLNNNRLVFTNSEHLYQVMTSPDKVNDVYRNKQVQNTFVSFTKKVQQQQSGATLNKFQEDLATAGLPQSYYNVLNENGEVQVGDTLIWYYKGQMHFVLNSDEEQLLRIKQDPSLSKLVGTYTVKTLVPGYAKNARVSISNGGNARPVYEYDQQSPVVGRRRFVHELKAVTQTAMSVFHVTYLWINARHEKLGGNGWEATSGELRHIYASVTGSYNLQNASGYTNPAYTPNTPVSINSSVDTQNSSVDFTIGSYSTRGVTPPTWDIELNGSITQQAYGDPNQFSDAGFPLW